MYPEDTEAARERYELLARRAYELFEARGGQPGREQEDWHEAERQLMAEEYLESEARTTLGDEAEDAE